MILRLLCLLFLTTTLCLAEQAAIQKQSGSWTAPDMKLYHAGQKAQISGNILSIEEGNGQGDENSLFFTLTTDKGDYLVDVGPRWLLLHDSFNFTKGQPMTVVGVTIRFQGKNAIEAHELTSGKQHIVLRDASGKPVREPAER